MTQVDMRESIPSRHESRIITPKEAAELLAPLAKVKRGEDEPPQKRLQRTRKNKRIKAYADRMRRGKWNSLSIIQIDEYEEPETNDVVSFVADGQNRLAAVIEANIPVRFDVLTREMISHDEVRAHYATIDINCVRTPKDVMKSQLFDQPKVLTESQYGKLRSALSVIMGGFKASSSRTAIPMATVDLMPAIMLYVDAAQHYYDLITPAKLVKADKEIEAKVELHKAQKALSARMQSSPVTALALQTLLEKQNVAAKFWNSVASTTAAAGSPEAQLAKFILTNKVDVLNSNVFCHVMAKCWNAFYAKEQISDADLNPAKVDVKTPIRIAGTKFSGKHFGYLNLEGKIVIDASAEEEEEPPTTEPATTVADQLHAIADADKQDETAAATEEARELATV